MRKAFFQLHTAVFLAGFTGILGRLITLNEVLLVWYRLLISVLTLWVLYYFKKPIQRIGAKDLYKIFAVGCVAALHWVTFYASIKSANVSVALVCFSSIGFFTAVMEPVIMHHRINIAEILLGVLTIAGIYIVFHFEPQFKTGIILGILSAFLGCLFPIFNKKLLKSISPETVTLFELTGGFIFITILMPVYMQFFPPVHFIPGWSDMGWLLVLSLLCTVVAFNLSMKALQKISAFTVNLTYNLEPLYGILLAFIFFREDQLMKESFYVGLSLIVISVMIQTMLIYRKHQRVR